MPAEQQLLPFLGKWALKGALFYTALLPRQISPHGAPPRTVEVLIARRDFHRLVLERIPSNRRQRKDETWQVLVHHFRTVNFFLSLLYDLKLCSHWSQQWVLPLVLERQETGLSWVWFGDHHYSTWGPLHCPGYEDFVVFNCLANLKVK